MWKGGFVVTVMTASVRNAGMKTSVCFYWEFHWEVELFFCLLFYPIDDLFPSEVQYLIMKHV